MDYSSWNVPAQTISFLNADMIIIISVLFVLGFVLIVRYMGKVVPAIVGAVAYVIFGFLGTEALCMILASIPGINSLVYANAVVYSVVRAVIIALMYQAARFITIKITSKEKYTIGNSMMAGFGMSVAYGLVSGFNYMYMSVMGSTINELGMEAMFEGYTQEEMTAMAQSFDSLVHAPSQLYIMLGIGAAIDIIFMVLICVVVSGVMDGRINKNVHFAVIAANAAIVLPTTLLECYSTDIYMTATVIKVAVLAFTIMGMLYADKTYLSQEFAQGDSQKYKTTTHLPRMKK